MWRARKTNCKWQVITIFKWSARKFTILSYRRNISFFFNIYITQYEVFSFESCIVHQTQVGWRCFSKIISKHRKILKLLSKQKIICVQSFQNCSKVAYIFSHKDSIKYFQSCKCPILSLLVSLPFPKLHFSFSSLSWLTKGAFIHL